MRPHKVDAYETAGLFALLAVASAIGVTAFFVIAGAIR